ncbi:hypothetical protein [Pinibacter soli]|uniref:Uncharacterized protein n=1 Tax=Pinibacter soli TaxID=3044211 RepID=A0ABT6R9S4_9BACT|nr:hypothetical protein [Pinibacter soli]MDI3319161.1 hypothetical protein [Pinibacter soli]
MSNHNRYFKVEVLNPIGVFNHWVTNFNKPSFIDAHYQYADNTAKWKISASEISFQDYKTATGI